MERKAFLDQEPPPGYIAGIGRGATGFVTQADFGTSKKLPLVTFESQGEADGNGRYADAVEPYQPILSMVEKEDLEADKIYDDIEKYLNQRRHKKRKMGHPDDDKNGTDPGGTHVEAEVSKSISEIAEQFEDAKKELATVTAEQWQNLPEAGDFTKRNKRLREEMQNQQRFYRNSDMIALSLKDSGATDFALDEASDALDNKNLQLEQGERTADKVDLIQLARTKDRLLENQIKMGKQSLNEEVDKGVYLEQLNPASNRYNIGDFKRTRKLLAKLRETKPQNPQNWIASAKLEIEAKKFNRAKEIIQEGCEKCPKSEEIWLTNLEIHSGDMQASKVIVADAIKYNYKSLKLWLTAADLELDNLSKVRILRKALEWLPNVVDLWLNLVNYEEDKEIAIKILQKATTIIPGSLALWLKLADLQDSQKAIEVLMQAIEFISENERYLVWIRIAEIEERETANEIKVDKYIKNAFNAFTLPDKKIWIEQAEKCDSDNLRVSCRVIMLNFLASSGESVEQMLESYKSELASNHKEVATSILVYLTSSHPDNVDVWLEYINLKRNMKQYSELFLVYETATLALPHNIELVTMYIDDIIQSEGNVQKIRSILYEAMEKNSNSERLWLYAINFEFQFGTVQICRDLFDACLGKIENPTTEIWLEKIRLERKLGEYDDAVATASEAIDRFPQSHQMYIQKGEILEIRGSFDDARIVYELGIGACACNSKLYICLARLYQTKLKNLIRARSILDQGLAKHPKDDLLHHSRVKLELDADNRVHAQRLLSKALVLVPSSPLLWCDNIRLAPKQQVKNMYASALKNTSDDPLIILTIAKDLWKLGKIDRSNQFFKACLEKDPHYGDAYIYHYAFLLKFGSREDMRDLEAQMLERKTLHGHRWTLLLQSNETRRIGELQLLREAAVDVSKSL